MQGVRPTHVQKEVRVRIRFRPLTPLPALVLSLALPAFGQTPITIIHVNDTHSHVDSFGPRDAQLEGTIGGLERAASLIGPLKATEPNALFLHAGDAFHGDFFFNAYLDVPELAILKQLGVDAMTVGNHEFDLTPAALLGALSTVGAFPMTSANLDFSGCPAPTVDPRTCAYLRNWIQPGYVKTVGGVKVGIFGLTIPTDPTMQPKPVVVRPDVVAVAQDTVAWLKSGGAQVVVLLSHLGLAGDRNVVATVPGIDVVVEGHDHALYSQPLMLDGPDGRTVPAVSAGDNYLNVGRLRLEYTEGYGVTVKDWDVLPVDGTVPPAPPVAAQVETLKQGIVAKYASYGNVYEDVVGYAPWPIPKRYDPDHQARDTAMGNLVTDALRHRTRTQIALTVTGLVSEGLYPGPIVGADVFRPVSYGYDPATGLGFRIATMDITGGELLKGMEICLTNVTAGDTYDLQFSGLTYRYDSTKPPFHRIVPGSVYVHGRRIHPARTYSLTVNEGIALLLPSMGVQFTNLKMRQDFEYLALRDYVARLHVVLYTPQGRIRDVSVRHCRF
jgi:5'-nucleotidase / UDP-sugar diphosphatase